MKATYLKNWLLVGFVVAIIGGAIALGAHARRALVLKQTHNDLAWIGMALHRYHDEHGHFPPAILRDENGAPMHSWRSQIQPYLAGIVETDDNFSTYDLKEAWDSPANTDADTRHRFGNHAYQFLAIVGPHAAWDSNGTRKLSDFSDGASNTILVIAIRKSGVAWREPRDAVFNGTELSVRDHQVELSQDVLVLTADGAVRYCENGIAPDILTALITTDAGDSVTEW